MNDTATEVVTATQIVSRFHWLTRLGGLVERSVAMTTVYAVEFSTQYVGCVTSSLHSLTVLLRPLKMAFFR